jgi:hypothetical protein
LLNEDNQSHGNVLIWKARDDKRYMHALHFEKDDLERNADSVLCVSFVFRWVVGRGKYYIDRPDDEYPVEDEIWSLVLSQIICIESYI